MVIGSGEWINVRTWSHKENTTKSLDEKLEAISNPTINAPYSATLLEALNPRERLYRYFFPDRSHNRTSSPTFSFLDNPLESIVFQGRDHSGSQSRRLGHTVGKGVLRGTSLWHRSRNMDDERMSIRDQMRWHNRKIFNGDFYDDYSFTDATHMSWHEDFHFTEAMKARMDAQCQEIEETSRN
ncbi:hypothetical protein V6N12_031283 [Hibiscus sabdariffa]|uniref:Uncharacterized protein n=1 Tax=Hibiscus sabdariffa TaxID=183260 RepID=A0ABR2E8I4_9ROSI